MQYTKLTLQGQNIPWMNFSTNKNRAGNIQSRYCNFGCLQNYDNDSGRRIKKGRLSLAARKKVMKKDLQAYKALSLCGSFPHPRSYIFIAASNSLLKYNLWRLMAVTWFLFRCWSWVAIKYVTIISKQKSGQTLLKKIQQIFWILIMSNRFSS